MAKEVVKEAVLIGHNVVWMVKETLLSLNDVTDVIVECGLDPAYLSEPTSKRAVCRAAKEVAKAENGRFEDSFVRKIADNDQKYSLCLLEEDRDKENDRLYAAQTTTVKFIKSSGTVECEGDKKEEFMEKYSEYKSGVTDDDIRAFVLKTVRHEGYGISLRPTGGIYFVPLVRDSVLQKLSNFLRKLDIGDIYKFRVLEGSSENYILSEAFKDEIKKQLEGIRTSVGKVSKRMKALDKKKDEVENLQEVVTAYQQVLDAEVLIEEIMEEIKTTNQVIGEKMKEIS